MYSYNNIVEKGEPEHKEIIDLALENSDTVPQSTQSRADPRVDCIVVDDFLTSDECDALVGACEKVGYSFWKQLNHDDADGENKCDASSKAVRVVDTIEGNFPRLAERLFARIAAVVDLRPKTFTADMDCADELYERDLDGTWVPHAIAENLLLGRYHPGGHFMPHVDGSTIVDLNTRSFYTLLVYLNDCPAGGHTYMFSGDQCNVMFLDKDNNKYRGSEDSRVGSVIPRKGRAAFFYYNLLHEAEPVADGLKYICRADLLYRRSPPILTGPKDIEAFELYQKARATESSGDAMAACDMFRRVGKLSKGVAALFQLD